MRMLDNVIDINYYAVKKARDSNLRQSCRPQSELRPVFWDSLHLAVSQPFVLAIVACVKPQDIRGMMI